MRRHALAIALVLGLRVAGAAPAMAQGATPVPAPESARSALIAATRFLHDACASGNAEAADSLLAPDYSLVDARGRRHERADVLALLRRHDVDLERTESTLDALRITLIGDVGVVSGVANDRLHFSDRDEQRARHFTEVWSRSGTRWQLVATHESAAQSNRTRPPPRGGHRP